METTRQSLALPSSSQPLVLGRVPAARGWRSHVHTARFPAPLGPRSEQATSRIIAQAVPPSRGAPARAVGAEALVAPVAPTVPHCDAFQSAKSLFEALNRRDVSAVLTLMSEEVVYDSLSTSASLRGRAAVGRFYLEALAAIPENAVFVLEPEDEQQTAAAGHRGGSGNVGAAPVLQAGLAWHMELNGVAVPLSRGMGVYWADPRTGLLTRVWENPEPAFKAAAPLLTSAVWPSTSPLLGGLTRGVSSLLNTLGSNSTNGSPVSSSDGGNGTSSSPFGSAPASTPGVPSLPDMASMLGGMLPFGGSPAAAATASSTASPQRAAAAGKAAPQPRRSAFSDHTGRVTTAPIVPTAQGARPSGVVSNGAWAAAAAAAAAKLAPASSAPAAPAAPATYGTAAPAAAAAASARAPAPTSAAVAAAPAAAAAAAVSTAAPAPEALSSKGEPIRMRPLSEPEPDSASTSSANGANGASSAAAPASSSEPAADPAAAKSETAARDAAPASSTSAASPILLPAAGSAAASSSQAPRSVPSGGGSNMSSFASMDDDGNALAGSSSDSGAAGAAAATSNGGGGGGGGGGWKLPFDRSYSMNVDLTSLWEKDGAASQVVEYEAMLDVLELGGLQKVTARLIDGLDLKQAEDKFEVSFVTIVPFFRVTEKSRFTAATTMMRRDLRGGRQSSIATRVPGGVEVKMTWDNPLAGSLTEEYLVSEDGTQLAVTSDMRIGQRQAKATQIYRRSSRNRNEFLNQQRSSYGSMEDVLKKQEQQYGKIKY